MDNELEYLFTVQFRNSYIYKQPTNDKSILEPNTKSAYYDLLISEKNGNPPIFFTLSNCKNNYSVNLLNGEFNINNASFFLESPQNSLLKLIYFRKISVTLGKAHKIVKFNFGWENPTNGIKKIIEIV